MSKITRTTIQERLNLLLLIAMKEAAAETSYEDEDGRLKYKNKNPDGAYDELHSPSRQDKTDDINSRAGFNPNMDTKKYSESVRYPKSGHSNAHHAAKAGLNKPAAETPEARASRIERERAMKDRRDARYSEAFQDTELSPETKTGKDKIFKPHSAEAVFKKLKKESSKDEAWGDESENSVKRKVNTENLDENGPHEVVNHKGEVVG